MLRMNKIAIDVVLLPPDDVMDICIEVNKTFGALSSLDKKKCLPHISLWMGVIEKNQLEEMRKRLQQLGDKFSSVPVEIVTVDYTLKPDGRKSWCFRVKKSKELVELHKLVKQAIHPLCTYDATTSMFNQDDPVDEQSLTWVNNFAKNHKRSTQFDPHISLRCKNDVVFSDVPIVFTASRLALCHLGDHCTCRRILFETELL